LAGNDEHRPRFFSDSPGPSAEEAVDLHPQRRCLLTGPFHGLLGFGVFLAAVPVEQLQLPGLMRRRLLNLVMGDMIN
jgi:hypothetical protein